MIPERPVDAVQWHEGMLLSPQHFQQAAQRNEAFVAYHVAAFSPWQWGVVRLRIDDGLLVGSGVVRVIDLEAILPDGLLAFHNGGDEGLEIDLADYRDQLEAGPLLIHLAVPARAPDSAVGDAARYRSVEGAPIVDENTGEGALAIPRLKPRLRLMAGPTPPAKFVSFPLLQVALRDETYERTDFMAPCLYLTTQSALGEILSKLIVRLREKAHFLAGSRPFTQRFGGRAASSERQAVIRSLVAALPPLEVLLSSSGGSPFAIYLALAGLAGQVAALGAGQVPPVPPRYCHEDLRATFLPLIDFVLRQIDGIQMLYREVPFAMPESGSFTLNLKQSWMRQHLVVGVRRRSGIEASAVAEWFGRCLIATEDQLSRLADRRILGAKRTAIERDDDLGIVPGQRMSLFAIDLKGGFIRPDALLVIDSRLDPDTEQAPPVDLVLFVPTSADGP